MAERMYIKVEINRWESEMTYEQLNTEAQLFLSRAFELIGLAKIKFQDYWPIDHLCYRVESKTEYEALKCHFKSFSNLLIESPVNGRLISTFKLHSPINFGDYTISVIELPEPKVGKSTKTGFEHFEIVCDQPFEKIIEQSGSLPWDKSGLAKPINKELEVSFGSLAFKYHHLSLESVIRLEENKMVFEALHTSNILDDLKMFSPLIAGTFPLGIETPDSDLDILICHSDLEEALQLLKKLYGEKEHFKYSRFKSRESDSVCVQFTINQIDFEIFCQSIPSVQQYGYQHFLAEEKVINFGLNSELFSMKNELKRLKLSGLKTEPAFAFMLGLIGDPYEEVLKLQKMPLAELIKLLQTAELNKLEQQL